MKTRTTKLIAAFALIAAAAAFTGCHENSSARDTSSNNRGMMDGRWPDWSNNGSADAKATTLGSGSDAGGSN